MPVTNCSYRLLILLFLLTSSLCFSQDLIVKKNGDRVYCKITDVDSLNIYYRRKPQKIIFSILRSDIENFYLARPLRTKQMQVQDTAVKSKKEAIILDVYGGVASPTGEFKNKDLTNAGAGFANTGALFHAAINFEVSRYFALFAAFHFQSHSFNTRLFDQQEEALNPGISVSSVSGHWKMNALYLGAGLTVPFPSSPQWSFNLNFGAGYAVCVLPELQTTLSYMGRSAIIDQRAAVEWTPSFSGDLGFRYKVSQSFGFHFGVGVFTAKPAFTNITTYSSNGQVSFDDYTQKMSSVNVFAGITLLLY